MIKAIIFDWGGVLIDEPAFELHKFCADAFGVSVELFDDVFSQYADAFGKGLIDENYMWQEITDKLSRQKPETKSLWGDAVKNSFHKKQEMFELIKKLHSDGYKIGFLSNTEMSAVEYWKRNDYEKYFDEVVFSCVEHMAKPDAKIYKLICNKLNVSPNEALFIDDKIEFINGAKRIGMEGVVFDNTEQVMQDLKNFKINI